MTERALCEQFNFVKDAMIRNAWKTRTCVLFCSASTFYFYFIHKIYCIHLEKILHIFTVAVLNIQKKRKKKKQIEKIYTYMQMYKWIFDFIYKYSYFFSTHFFHYQLSWRDCNNRYWKSIINSTSDEEIKNKYEKQIRYFQSRSGSCV